MRSLVLYGAPAFMEIQQQQFPDAIAHIDGARLVSREYPGDVRTEEVTPQDQVMAGIPNMDLFSFLNWYGWEHTGEVAYGPIMPLTDEDGRQVRELLARHCATIDRDFGEAFALTPRSMQMFALVLYNAADRDDLEGFLPRVAGVSGAAQASSPARQTIPPTSPDSPPTDFAVINPYTDETPCSRRSEPAETTSIRLLTP